MAVFLGGFITLGWGSLDTAEGQPPPGPLVSPATPHSSLGTRRGAASLGIRSCVVPVFPSPTSSRHRGYGDTPSRVGAQHFKSHPGTFFFPGVGRWEGCFFRSRSTILKSWCVYRVGGSAGLNRAGLGGSVHHAVKTGAGAGQKETDGLNHTWPCLVSGAHLGKGRQRWGLGVEGRERDCFFSLGGGGPSPWYKNKGFQIGTPSPWR